MFKSSDLTSEIDRSPWRPHAISRKEEGATGGFGNTNGWRKVIPNTRSKTENRGSRKKSALAASWAQCPASGRTSKKSGGQSRGTIRDIARKPAKKRPGYPQGQLLRKNSLHRSQGDRPVNRKRKKTENGLLLAMP